MKLKVIKINKDTFNEINIASPNNYLNQARDELFRVHNTSTTGFRDNAGYIVDYINGLPTTRGEATLHTAIAAIAISSGNFNNQDAWEINNVNQLLKELLTTLLYHSWGNKDISGNEHPIRHPDVIEYDASGQKIRCSPLTKDSFGAVITAGCFSYICPHSNNEVKSLARDLIIKWSEYLTKSLWRTHSNYISGEFESEKINGKLYYRNIFSEGGGRIMYKGPESYMLMPHEIYALKNAVRLLGRQTNHWTIWETPMPLDLKKIIINDVVPFLVKIIKNKLHAVLNTSTVNISFDCIENGPSKNEIEVKEFIVENLCLTLLDSMTEHITSDLYMNSSDLAITKNLSNTFLSLDDPQYKDLVHVLTEERILDENWLEVVVFLGTQQLLKLMGPDVVSYTVWPFISECISQPKAYPLLKISSKDFFSYLKKNHNSNGLWAWFAGRKDIVQEQLDLFESKPHRYWWKFAYGSTKFEEWMVEPTSQQSNGKESPRLDYLVLHGLNEMGYEPFMK